MKLSSKRERDFAQNVEFLGDPQESLNLIKIELSSRRDAYFDQIFLLKSGLGLELPSSKIALSSRRDGVFGPKCSLV